MISTTELKNQTRRDLADKARDIGVTGWHAMKKDELIEAIRKAQPPKSSKSGVPSAVKKTAKNLVSKKTSKTEDGTVGETAPPRKRPIATKQPAKKPNGKVASQPQSEASNLEERAKESKSTRKPVSPRDRKPTSPAILKVLRKQQASAESRKDLSACVLVKQVDGKGSAKPALKERIVLIVRDSYWLQASWIITRQSVDRARAAMGADWHTCEPILRLLEVNHAASANTSEQLVRDIPIHGGVNNWYIDVENPPNRYRVLIGYRANTGKFYTLYRSNIVQTPEPGACDPIDGHWQDIAEDYERIYSLSDNDTGSNDLREMFEERLQRPMLDLKSDHASNDPDLSFRREKDLPFVVEAELIVYGSTAPGASVTLAGAPVRLRPDGTFTVRMELPDRRQVLPVVACSRDGMRQRTTVIAVERNTKVMEPVSKNAMDM